MAYPRISNLDEFQPLKIVPGVRLQRVRSLSELSGLSPTDWIILPGSKNTSGDLAWLRVRNPAKPVSDSAACRYMITIHVGTLNGRVHC